MASRDSLSAAAMDAIARLGALLYRADPVWANSPITP